MIFKLNSLTKLNNLYSEKLATRINKINIKYEEGDFSFIKNEHERKNMINAYLYVNKNKLSNLIKNIEVNVLLNDGLDIELNYKFFENKDIRIMYKSLNSDKDNMYNFVKNIQQIKYILVNGWDKYVKIKMNNTNSIN